MLQLCHFCFKPGSFLKARLTRTAVELQVEHLVLFPSRSAPQAQLKRAKDMMNERSYRQTIRTSTSSLGLDASRTCWAKQLHALDKARIGKARGLQITRGIHGCIYMRIYKYSHACMYVGRYVRTDVCMSIYIYIYIYV